MSSQRRLAARRGSSSALDPFNVHAQINSNPNRSSSSTLTIVRVAPTPTTPTPPLHDPPSPILAPRRSLRRHSSNQNPPQVTSPDPPRLSFAFSSFSSQVQVPHERDRAPSPSSSPRLRPSSPRLSFSGGSFSSRPRLTPDQLLDVARQATQPRTQSAHNPPSAATASYSPVLRAHSPIAGDPPAQGVVAPATFTPLPDDIFLPFIDRPTEVTTLISSPPDLKLFQLLAQTFRKISSDGSDITTSTSTPIELPSNPLQWTYEQLIYHLTHVDRDIAPDPIWAIAARTCIHSHSELIWERVKGALGVPPELDIDFDFAKAVAETDRRASIRRENKERKKRQGNNDDSAVVDDGEGSTSSLNTEDISDDEGRAAHGYWSDWDAIMDSPVYSRSFKGFHTEDSQATINPTALVATRSRSPIEQEMVIGMFSPSLGATLDNGYEGDFEDQDQDHHVSIEPLLTLPPSTSSAIPPPLSLVSGDGLGDIAEGAEEEEEEGEGKGRNTPEGKEEAHDPDLISPSQIQGLRISTSPVPVSIATGPKNTGTPLLSPISPLPPYNYPENNSGSRPQSVHAGSRPQSIHGSTSRPQSLYSSVNVASGSIGSHSRTSSFSSVGPFQRTESMGNLYAALVAGGAGGGGSNYAVSEGGESDLSHSMVSEGQQQGRGPLFPSNFARLGSGRGTRSTTTPRYSFGQALPASVSAPAPGSLSGRAAERAFSQGASSVEAN